MAWHEEVVAIAAARRAAGEQLPQLERIAELVIAPSTDPARRGQSVLRVTAAYDDGSFRATSWPLPAIVADHVLHDDSIVTKQWHAARRGVQHGSVDMNPGRPPKEDQPPAPTKGEMKADMLRTIDTVLSPVVVTVGEQIRSLRADLEATQASPQADVVRVVGTVLTPVVDKVAEQIKALRADLAREKARADELESRIKLEHK